MNAVVARWPGQRWFVLLATAVGVICASLFVASAARAAETIYWDNYGADNIAFANLDGSGGGILDLGSNEISSPEGMAYDSVTNRLFVANADGVGGQGEILAINLDGSGAAPFSAPGAPIEEPEGVAVDPATRTIYWVNEEGARSISWAKLDGSEGGTLNLGTAPFEGACCRIAVDPSGGRVYWVNETATPASIGFANLDGTGGGELNLNGSTVEPNGQGLAVDTNDGRLYFAGASTRFGYASLNGTGGGDVSIGTAFASFPWGLALDPATDRLYWANEGSGGSGSNAFGFADLSNGSGGNLTIATTPVKQDQDPLILKSPSGTGAPAVARGAGNPGSLTCSTGSWAPDYAGGFMYQAPRSFSYQWSNNGTAIAGAAASAYTATSPGTYVCTVTATNQTGSASQASPGVGVNAAKLRLSTKKKAQAKPGKSATFKVSVLNRGDLTSPTAKVCVTLPRKARKTIKAPKCKKLGPLAAGGKRSATLKLKVAKKAKPGTYKVSIIAKGAPANTVKAKLVVKG